MPRNAKSCGAVLKFADGAEPRNRSPVLRPFSPFGGGVWERDYPLGYLVLCWAKSLHSGSSSGIAFVSRLEPIDLAGSESG